MDLRSVSIDRREAYYERAAGAITKDPLGFYTRAEKGRAVQAGVKTADLQPWTPERLEALRPKSNILHLKTGNSR